MSTLYSANGRIFNINGRVLRVPDHRSPFVITIDTNLPTAGNTFIIPFTNNVTNCVVECSDGQEKYITNYLNNTITFTQPGIYTLKFRGEAGWSFNNGGDYKKIITINSWGDFKFNYLRYGFYGCANLVTIPTTGSINAPTLISSSFERLFSNCTSLTNFGSPNMFERSGEIVGASFLFNQCTSIIGEVPNNFFDKLTKVTSFQNVLYGTNITSLPTDIFRYNTLVTTFSNAFQNCSNLSSLPTDIFRYNTAVTNFLGAFISCTNLTSLPTDIFRYNTAVTNFGSCFQASGLVSISADLFKYNTALTSLSTTFYQSKLTSIPVDLLRYNTLLNNVALLFASCPITSLPSDLFRYNTAITNFGNNTINGTFQGCGLLTSLPTDLFRYNINATVFSATFQLCSSLTSLPVDLFRYNTLATNFSSCFNRCTTLASLPAGLFDYNTAVTTFNGCFVQCSITSIPNNLFYNNANVTDYGGVFQGNRVTCPLPTSIWNLSNLNKVTTWLNMMNVSLTASFTGTVQDIWNYASAGSVKTDCFNNCTGLSNYTSIPTAWI